MMRNNFRPLATWLYDAGSWIFPPLTELQIAFAYSVGFGLLIVHPSVLQLLWNVMGSTAHANVGALIVDMLYLVVLVAPFVVILRKKTLSDGMKAFIEALYFLFLALLSLAALSTSGQLTSGTADGFDWFNAWVARLTLGLAILRMFLALLAARSEIPAMERFVSQNFKDTQFRLAAFGVTFVIGLVSVLLLQHFYTNAAVVALLSLAYGGIVIALLGKFRAATLT